MTAWALVLPDSRRGFALRPDGRLVALPVRAAAAGAGRRARPAVQPELAGRVVAVGGQGRWTWVVSRDGESLTAVSLRPRGGLESELSLRAPCGETGPGLGAVLPLGSAPDGLLVQEGSRLWRLRLGEAAVEALTDGLLALAPTRDGGAEWVEVAAGGAPRLGRLAADAALGAPVFEGLAGEARAAVPGVAGRRSAAGRGVFAWRLADGSWRLTGGAALRPPPSERVLGACPSPVRGGPPGLVLRSERGLSFFGSPTRLALDAGPAGESWAACPVAPWLLEARGDTVTLRELGPRWGRRLARWELEA